MRQPMFIATLILAAGLVQAEEAPEGKGGPPATEPQQVEEDEKPPAQQAPKEEGAKSLSGMSILGNQEAPKSLVIVPWKSSELGASLGIATMLDASKLPIDKEVFLRALSYYEIRSGRK